MSNFVEYLVELLMPLKYVRARKMFGGYGIYREEIMFGLVADDVLYFKADEETIPDYEALGLGPFLFEKNGKMVAMSYYQAPEDAMDSSSDLCEWAEKAYSVALRTKNKKRNSQLSGSRRKRSKKKA